MKRNHKLINVKKWTAHFPVNYRIIKRGGREGEGLFRSPPQVKKLEQLLSFDHQVFYKLTGTTLNFRDLHFTSFGANVPMKTIFNSHFFF